MNTFQDFGQYCHANQFHPVQMAECHWRMLDTDTELWVDYWPTDKYRGCQAKTKERARTGGIAKAGNLLKRMVERDKKGQPATYTASWTGNESSAEVAITKTDTGVVAHAAIKPIIYEIADSLAGAVERFLEAEKRPVWRIPADDLQHLSMASHALKRYNEHRGKDSP